MYMTSSPSCNLQAPNLALIPSSNGWNLGTQVTGVLHGLFLKIMQLVIHCRKEIVDLNQETFVQGVIQRSQSVEFGPRIWLGEDINLPPDG